MKRALILGGRVMQVTDADFPVSKSFQWVDCADDTAPYLDTWDGSKIVKGPAPAPAPAAKSDTQALLDALVEKGVVTLQEIEAKK